MPHWIMQNSKIFIHRIWPKNIHKYYLNNHFQATAESEMNTIEFYYQQNNISTFKQDTKPLKDIAQRHLKGTPPYQHVSMKMYY